ncbi:circularly permuted type 2 ATP-grasp protein [Microbacterium sp.]|uniref:circularly permuted type 2 ATP-grasp protein n=1 Tax=Microbacterium sp. TaxID=51671 RepID=UPI003C788D6C
MSVLRDYASAVSQPTLPFGASDDLTARYDEVIDAEGSLRPAWKALAAQALALTPMELDRVSGEIARFLADDGVSYLRPGSGAVPWQLDPMPLVIDAADWSKLEVGVAQRAELLNALLTDIYGPQELLRSGILPASIVVGHAGFLRPLARPSAFDPHPLLLSAADLGRDAHGRWHVLADRVQAPSGLGFAAENRRVLSQVLPELYQERGLHRIDPYFAALRAAFLSAAPKGLEDPRIVILSPGTLSETAFDQAFLAGALGLPMVQGSDLVVHDGHVWMKPARWPRTAPTERIDVIVRRVDADFCDPLELRGDSRLGVAGLTEAVRRGTVRIVNGLGSGVLENPALLPFLPAACERLLGERLRLPSAPTWWCGDDDDRAFVQTRIAADDPNLIVRPFDQPRKAVADLSPAELIARIDAAPHRFVGQELLPLSQTPTWSAGGRLEARPLMFRAFALRYGSTYRPLAGGLVTMRKTPESAPRAQDVWVLKAAESEPDQHLAEITPLPTMRTIPALAPRALADLFWTGRYAERTEDLLRLLLSAQARFDEVGAGDRDRSVSVLLDVLRMLAGRRYDDTDAEFRSLLLDADRPGSAGHSIARLRDAMEAVRDQLSVDTWRVFSNIDRATRSLEQAPHAHRTAESAGRMLAAMLSLYGVTENMIRDTGWHMIKTGRYLERGLQLCHLLRVTATEQVDPLTERDLLDSLLLAAESVVTYRRRYRGAIRIADVLELLLVDAENPRSLLFAVGRLRVHLGAMPASTGSSRAERLREHLQTQLEALDGVELAHLADGRGEALTPFLSSIVSQLEQLSDAISQLHFASGPPPVPMSELDLDEVTEVRA